MKGTLKRVMSGVLSVITIASAVAQPMTAYAAEPEKAASSFEAQYPELETVKDKLAADEILTANDYSIDYGSDFDIKVDFSGIEGINDAKVKVELYEAKNEAGGSFQSAAARTLGFAQKVASGGLDNALREYNREDLVGKPSEVVWTELLHEFTNSGASVEDNMAADALSQAMDNLEIEDIADIPMHLKVVMQIRFHVHILV